MILEGLVVFGALGLVAGLKLWMVARRIRAAKEAAADKASPPR